MNEAEIITARNELIDDIAVALISEMYGWPYPEADKMRGSRGTIWPTAQNMARRALDVIEGQGR